MESEQSHIAWHPAFVQAIQMELEDYGDSLEFYPEFQLTSEPLKIDCVVIKKVKDVLIKKNIAAIFREINLLEYKSPEDYVSIANFYKVYGYACLYASLEKVPITSLTMTFVESHYPVKLLGHLKNVRGYSVEKTGPGIYNITGDILPIQVIDNRQLSPEENLWLKDLDNNLGRTEANRITSEVLMKGKGARLEAYIDVIYRANKERFMESNMVTVAEKILKETGYLAKLEATAEAKGEARGEERKAIDMSKDLIAIGLPFETIVSVSKLAPEKVKELYK